ncbi:hypothetical protein [Actinomadura mexicana]|uniref:Uncharacterized protein n=1 Tax=Actinomadura mexicana TaxID=134959 RepID=A0A238VWV2_9ACTN|nr:hypothetical protein [Actinomadura mexicana]SNR38661.1 hypothetical protein SAMN06265355_102468 [Actinomadura mexicana]
MDTSPSGDFEVEMEIEVAAEMTLAESSRPGEITNLPVSEWPFDPVDVERDETALRNLLGAVKALEEP